MSIFTRRRILSSALAAVSTQLVIQGSDVLFEGNPQEAEFDSFLKRELIRYNPKLPEYIADKIARDFYTINEGLVEILNGGLTSALTYEYGANYYDQFKSGEKALPTNKLGAFAVAFLATPFALIANPHLEHININSNEEIRSRLLKNYAIPDEALDGVVATLDMHISGKTAWRHVLIPNLLTSMVTKHSEDTFDKIEFNIK